MDLFWWQASGGEVGRGEVEGLYSVHCTPSQVQPTRCIFINLGRQGKWLFLNELFRASLEWERERGRWREAPLKTGATDHTQVLIVVVPVPCCCLHNLCLHFFFQKMCNVLSCRLALSFKDLKKKIKKKNKTRFEFESESELESGFKSRVLQYSRLGSHFSAQSSASSLIY